MPKALLKIFLLWLGLLLVVGMASTHFSVYRQGTCNVKNQLPYYRWDSFWYTSIARHGYTFSETKNSSIAFFPFYPMVIKAGYEITHLRQDWLSFGMNIFFAAGLAWLLYRLVRFDYDEKISLAIVAVILFFPSSYFFLAGYPDVLFVLLVAMSLYLARQQKWAWAGLAAGLLAITKPYGIFMVPVLLLEYLQDNHWDWKVFYKKFDWLALLLPLVSFGGFLGFNFWKFGSPIAFLKTQQTWGRSLANPLAALWQEAQHYLLGGQLFSGSNFPY
ncbi:MAG: glycosyltransferase family 39 protein, partial [Candidatus Moraniibacteriota bacterium]